MTNWHIIRKVLADSKPPMSVKQIWHKVNDVKPMRRTTVSTILNKMYDQGKVDYLVEQCGRRRMKFFYPLDEGDGK